MHGRYERSIFKQHQRIKIIKYSKAAQKAGNMQRLKEDIKNKTFHKFYLLFGEEDYLKKIYKDNLKNAILVNSDNINYSYFEGRNIDILQIQETAETLPFFSDYRVILIEDSGLFKSANSLPDYLANMPESTVIIFVEKEVDKRNKLYKFVNKEGLAVELKEMGIADLKRFIAIMLNENNKQIRENAADYFLQQVGSSLLNITNEIDKLVSYTYGRSEITISDIDTICCVQLTGRIFNMIDYAVIGEKDKALQLYHDLLELRESPMSILYLITRQFNILLQVKESVDIPRSQIASKLQIPSFTVGKYINQAKKFENWKLKEILDACIETEYKFKCGLLDSQIGVEILLIKLGQSESNLTK